MTGAPEISSAADIKYDMLGPLRVVRDGVSVPLGGRQQRAVLAVLLIEANRVVSLGQLVDAVWGERVPRGSTTTLQTYVFHLREILEPGRPRAAASVVLVTENGGYRLRVAADAVDAAVFELRVRAGCAAAAAGRFEEASTGLSQALGLWRGPVLADLAGFDFAQQEATRLNEVRLAAIEARIEADLALGRHAGLVAELDQLCRAYPLRETLHGYRMLALYRCGRQSDALAAYAMVRATFAEELGLDPGLPLRDLHQAVLVQDPALDWRPAATAITLAEQPSLPTSTGIGRRHRRRSLVAAGVTALLAATGGVAAVVAGRDSTGLRSLSANSVGILGSDGVLRAAVPVGQSPESIAATADAVWVANTGDATVSRISVRTRAVTQTVPVHAGPVALAVAGDDVWVVNGLAGDLSEISTQTNTTVDTVAVGNQPSAIAFGFGWLWVANQADGTVMRVDPAGFQPIQTIEVGTAPDGIAVGGGAVWVSNRADNTVSRINPQALAVTALVRVGSGPRGIVAAPGGVWVANSLDLTVSHIDPATDAVDASPEVGDTPTSIVADASSVWVSNAGAATVARIDPRTKLVTRQVFLGSSPRGIALVGSALWLAGQTSPSPAHRGGTLIIADDGGLIASIDPVLTYEGLSSWSALHLVYDGLVGLHRVAGAAGYELVPDLARTLPTATDGGKTYAFTLRDGIRYSDGSPVTAGDLRRGIERIFMKGAQPPSYFDAIRGATACRNHPGACHLDTGIETDDLAGTVIFHLTRPDPDLLAKLTSIWASAAPPAAPAHDIGTHPLPGTGPYMISQYTPRGARPEALTLVRNPYFSQWSSAAQPDGLPDMIRWAPEKTHAQGLRDVQAGRADLIYPAAEEIASLAKNYPAQLKLVPAAFTQFVVLNATVAPFQSPRARQAVAHALNRDPAIAALFYGSVACRLVPPNYPGYTAGCAYPRDLAIAKALVTASGTRGAQVHVYFSSHKPFAQIGRHVAGVLTEIGYHATLTLEDQYHYQIHDARRPVNIEGFAWAPDFPAISQFYYPTVSCQPGALLPMACDPRLDKLAAQATQALQTDPGAANRLWRRIYQLLDADARIIASNNGANPVLLSARVGNYTTNPIFGPELDLLWVR